MLETKQRLLLLFCEQKLDKLENDKNDCRYFFDFIFDNVGFLEKCHLFGLYVESASKHIFLVSKINDPCSLLLDLYVY